MHIQNPEERAWLETRMEPTGNRPEPDSNTRRRILNSLIKSTQFEQFLNKAYVGVTRFSLEGGDGLIPALDVLIEWRLPIRDAGKSFWEWPIGEGSMFWRIF